MKITFKKRSRSKGLSGIGEGFYIEVKSKKKRFALISGGSYNSKGIDIQVAVKAGESWDWVFLKNKATTEIEAKDFLQKNIDTLIKKYNYELHFFED